MMLNSESAILSLLTEFMHAASQPARAPGPAATKRVVAQLQMSVTNGSAVQYCFFTRANATIVPLPIAFARVKKLSCTMDL